MSVNGPKGAFAALQRFRQLFRVLLTLRASADIHPASFLAGAMLTSTTTRTIYIVTVNIIRGNDWLDNADSCARPSQRSAGPVDARLEPIPL